MKDNNEINKNDITQNNKKVEKDSDKKSKIIKKKSKSKIISNASNNNINIIIENEPIEKIQLKEEIRKNEKNLKKLNPLHFEFISNLSKSEMNFRVDNTFEVFNSILGQMCLVYAFKLENKYNSIATYNIIDYKTMGVLRNAHREDITNFRHYLDKRNRRDLILSVSATDNNARMWDINNLEFIITINNSLFIGNTNILAKERTKCPTTLKCGRIWEWILTPTTSSARCCRRPSEMFTCLRRTAPRPWASGILSSRRSTASAPLSSSRPRRRAKRSSAPSASTSPMRSSSRPTAS